MSSRPKLTNDDSSSSSASSSSSTGIQVSKIYNISTLTKPEFVTVLYAYLFHIFLYWICNIDNF